MLGTRLWQGQLLCELLVVATPAVRQSPIPPIPTHTPPLHLMICEVQVCVFECMCVVLYFVTSLSLNGLLMAAKVLNNSPSPP